MSRGAWIYVWSILILGAVLTVFPLQTTVPLTEQWLVLVALTTLAALTQLFKANAPNRKLYYPNLVFVFAGLLMLHPFLFAMLVIVSYLIEWAKERLTDSPDLRAWYLQPFNIAMIIISGAAARSVITLMGSNSIVPDGFSTVVTFLLASAVFVGMNQILLAIALVLARGMSWKEAATLDLENIQADLIHSLLGYVVAVVWGINPWLVVPTVAPLILTYRALMVPQLKKDASTDSKTGLWNTGYFNKLFSTELDRAKRFGHPISVILSDLDLLRNVNNTYGHLAGDTVLVGIGQIIRSTVREYDIAARFGGEEFTIALPETALEEAMAIAERLRVAVERASFQVKTSETPIHVTMSFGVASFPQDGETANDLVHQADVAVYQAKLKGRNCVVDATNVPHSLKLQGLPPDRGTAVAYVAPSSSTQADARATKPKVTRPVKAVRLERRADPRTDYPDAWLGLFVGAVIIAGLAAAMTGLSLDQLPDLTSVLVLSLMAILTELYEVRLYGDSTFSVSVAIVFASALIAGVLGVMAVSLAIVFAHFLRNREIALYKPAFNWATHVLAGLAPLIVFRVFHVSLGFQEIIYLTVLAIPATFMYYMIETGLVSIAISLSAKLSIVRVWREQFQWMAIYYAALCLLGLFMGVIYSDDANLGILGVIVVSMPVALVYYAQKQYVERTENSVHELDRMNEELSIANREVLAASEAIQQVNEELFLTVAKIIEARDPYVLGHASKVADYARAIGLEMNLPADRLGRLHQAGLMHDLGKMGVAEKILNKPGKLTDPEYEQVKKHATIGAEVLEASQGLRQLSTFVRHHHEWWNGSGYPDQWGGEQIPLEARILAVCDAVDSMASDRPYHKALQLDQVISEIERCSGTQFDPNVVEVLKRIVKQKDNPMVANSPLPPVEKRAGTATAARHTGWLGLPGELNGAFLAAD